MDSKTCEFKEKGSTDQCWVKGDVCVLSCGYKPKKNFSSEEHLTKAR
jgi:hypothetical protein